MISVFIGPTMKFLDSFVKLKHHGHGFHQRLEDSSWLFKFFSLKSDLSMDPQSLASSQRGPAVENHLSTEVKLLWDPQLGHPEHALKGIQQSTRRKRCSPGTVRRRNITSGIQ